MSLVRYPERLAALWANNFYDLPDVLREFGADNNCQIANAAVENLHGRFSGLA
jgi:hypothetical protein